MIKVALVYDRVNKWGGAESVLLSLHKMFPKAPLYTSVYDKKKAPWADAFDPSTGSGQGVKTSYLQDLPFSTRHELYAVLMPIAFESFSFDEYDLVISVTSESGKGIITKPNTVHICYCLTPTRYLWSGYNDYFKNPFLRFLSKPAVYYLRAWDKIAAQRPDVYVAISKEVRGRIEKYYRRESKLIYPPITLNARGPAARFPSTPVKQANSAFGLRSASASALPAPFDGVGSLSTRVTPRYQKNYFLIVSRLVSYKRIDIAVRAFNKLKLPLKIVGIGSEERYLKSISSPNIEFLGYLTEEELVRYYRGCRALIFPGIEDFGLTILEVQSFGKPVVAFKGGGSLETVVEGKTGEFFYPQNEEALVKKIKEFKSSKYNPIDCVKQAERFSYERFKKEFMRLVNFQFKI